MARLKYIFPIIFATGLILIPNIQVHAREVVYFQLTNGVFENGGQLTGEVRLHRENPGTVTVDFETRDISATAGLDYTALSGTLRWDGSDDSPRPVSIPIINDSVLEGNETFEFLLKNSSGDSIINQGLLTIKIFDDDEGIGFYETQLEVPEIGAADVEVARFGPGGKTFTVQYSVQSGSALNGSDFTAVQGSLSWGPNDFSRQSIIIPILEDTVGEIDEHFFVTLFDPSGTTPVAQQDPARVIILDDDRMIQFDASDINKPEFSFPENVAGGEALVPILRTGDSNGEIRVNYLTDYWRTTGGAVTNVSGELVWASGEGGVKYIRIPVHDDSWVQSILGRTDFNLILWGPVGARIKGRPEAQISILEDDTEISFSYTGPIAVYEDVPGGKYSVFVRRIGNISGTDSIDFNTISRTALPNEDYIPISTRLTWSPNDIAMKEIQIELINDPLAEPVEVFDLELSNPSANVDSGLQYWTFQILDDENRTSGVLSFGYGGTDETEEDLYVHVYREQGDDGRITVDFATQDGTAKSGLDYVAQSGTLIWESGDRDPKIIKIPHIDDSILEGDEIFNVQFSNLTGGAEFRFEDFLEVRINDNESAPAGAFSFNVNKVGIYEGNHSAFVQIQRLGGTSGRVEVELVSRDKTAIQGVDYQIFGSHLIWGRGSDDVRVVQIRILDAGTSNNIDKEFELELRNPTNGASLGIPFKIPVTIFNLDPTIAGWFILNEQKRTILENHGNLEIKVDRRGGTMGAVSVDFETRGVTASPGSDFTSVSGTLNWNDNEVGSKSFFIPILTDLEIEERETLEIILKNPTNGSILKTLDPGVVTILDPDNVKPGTAGFVDSSMGVAIEGQGPALVAIERKDGLDTWLEIEFESVNGTAHKGIHFDLPVPFIRFEDGESGVKQFEFPIIDNNLAEIDKSFTLKIVNVRSEFGIPQMGLNQKDIKIRNDDIPVLNVSDQFFVEVGQDLTVDVIPEPPLDTLEILWVPESTKTPIFSDDPSSLQTIMNFDTPGIRNIQLWASVGLGFRSIKTVIFNVGVAPLAPLEEAVNLFNPAGGGRALIPYQMAEPGRIQIILYDRLGTEVINLKDQDHSVPANGMATWDGRDSDGKMSAAGVYNALIREGNSTRKLKLILIK